MALDLVAIRRDFHRFPETALREYRTADAITAILASLGLVPRRVGQTGVVADINGHQAGPIIALRADIDALPIEERSGVAFASENADTMHACGHDAHTAMLIGAAERLLAERSALRGTVRLVFQPAEETTEGARIMVAEGVLDGVTAIFGLHNVPGLPVGTAAFRTGPLMAASDKIVVEVTGKGGHAATPHLAADPLVAAAAVLTGLQAVVSRAVDPLEPVVVTIGVFQGGTTFNVIPASARLEGTVRSYSRAVRAALPGLLTTAAQSIAAGYRCSATVHYQPTVPAVDNDPQLTNLARQVAVHLLGGQKVVEAQPTMGAEDFAVYQELVPGCFFWLGSGGPHNWHHPEFTLDEGCLPIGAHLMADIAKRALDVGVNMG